MTCVGQLAPALSKVWIFSTLSFFPSFFLSFYHSAIHSMLKFTFLESFLLSCILHYTFISLLTLTWFFFFMSKLCCSVTQSCPTLCDSMDCSTPGLPVHHQLLEFTKTHVQSVMPSKNLILCCPLLLLPSIFPSIRVFSYSQLFTSDVQSIGVSASTSVLPVNTQD